MWGHSVHVVPAARWGNGSSSNVAECRSCESVLSQPAPFSAPSCSSASTLQQTPRAPAGSFPPPASSPPLQASFSGSVSLLPVARSRCLFRKRKQISLLQRRSQNLFLKVNLWERASPKMRLSVLLSRECGQEVLTSPSPGKRSRFEPSSRYAGSRAKLPESTQEARGTGQQHSSCFLYASLGCKACLEHGGCSVEWMGTSGPHLRPEACRDSSSASGHCSLGCSCL